MNTASSSFKSLRTWLEIPLTVPLLSSVGLYWDTLYLYSKSSCNRFKKMVYQNWISSSSPQIHILCQLIYHQFKYCSTSNLLEKNLKRTVNSSFEVNLYLIEIRGACRIHNCTIETLIWSLKSIIHIIKWLIRMISPMFLKQETFNLCISFYQSKLNNEKQKKTVVLKGLYIRDCTRGTVLKGLKGLY